MERTLIASQRNLSIGIVCGYSLDEVVIKNRLRPIIKVGLAKGYTFTVICAGAASLNIDSARLNYVRVNHRLAKSGGFFVRAISEAALAIKLLVASASVQKSITLITIPSMFCLFFARRDNSLMVLDVRDLTWEYLSDSFVGSICRPVLVYFARWSFGIFDIVCCTNFAERRHLFQQMRVPREKVVLMPNGVSAEAFVELTKISLERKSLETKKMRITYAGNIGVAQNLSIFIDSALRLPDVEFAVVGDGVDFQRLDARIRNEKITNVRLCGRLDFNELVSIYERSDILYAQLSRNFRTAVPSKLYEYLATGRAIIYGGSDAAAEVLSDFKDVKIISPDNVDDLVQAIKEMSDLRCRAYSGYFNRELIRNKYLRESGVHSLYRRLSEFGRSALVE